MLEHEICCREIVVNSLEIAVKNIRSALEREKRKNHTLTLKRIYSSGNVPMPDLDRAAAEWRNANYAANPYKPENRIYMTNCGIMVRSKSEKIIADRLWELRVNFRYEAQMFVDDRILYQDFTLRTKEVQREIRQWLVFGLPNL